MIEDTDKLIAALADDLKPVRPMRFARGMAWLAGSVLVTATVALAHYGPRADLAAGRPAPMLPIAGGIWLILGVACAAAAISMGNPQVGRRQSGWPWAAAMASVLPLAALWTWMAHGDAAHRPPIGALDLHCTIPSIFLGLLIAVVLMIRLHHAAPTSPERAGLLVGIASGSIGVFAYSLHCPVNSIEHIGLGHALPVLISAALGRLFLPYLLRW